MNYTFKDRPTSDRIRKSMENHSDSDPTLTLTFLNLQWTYRELEKEYGRLLEKYHLSESSFIILMLLLRSETERLSPSEVADKLGSTRATASKLLKRMERDGLVTKGLSSQDKRAAWVQLTEAGRKVLDAFLPYNFLIVDKLFKQFTPEEIIIFNQLLDKLSSGTNGLKMEEWK